MIGVSGKPNMFEVCRFFCIMTFAFVAAICGCGEIVEEENGRDGGPEPVQDGTVYMDARSLADAGNVQPQKCSRLDLMVQNECGTGRRCTILFGDPLGGSAQIGCTAPGSLSAWSNCIPTLPNGVDDCEAGTVCVDLFSTGNPRCHPFCESVEVGHCEDGLCGVTVPLPQEEAPIFLCIPHTPCDPVYNSGCFDPLGCYWSPQAPDVTTCLPKGTKGAESPCGYHLECLPGSTCHGEPGERYCRRLCETPPTGWCAGGADCMEAGSTEFGVCMP